MCPRVLVAEDDPVNQKIARSMLARLGYAADVVAGGQAAVNAVARSAYAAILMDVMMPKIDGFEATRRIRAAEAARAGNGRARRTPIIALTAFAMAGDRERCLAVGMDEYLAKPVSIEGLGVALARWAAVPVRSGKPAVDVAAGESIEPVAVLAPTSAPTPALTPARVPALIGTADDAPAPPRSDEALDGVALARLADPSFGGAPELLDELLEIFLTDAPRRLAALRDAIGARDATALGRVAHAFKSSCGSLGARQMQALCVELEERGRRADLVGMPALVDGLTLAFEVVRTRLEVERRAIGG